MAALRSDRTSFVIAHRLSTIRDADVILVMEDGAIVEQGDHAALLALDGAYSRLYRAQFSGAAVDDDAEPTAGGAGEPALVGAVPVPVAEAAEEAGPPASAPLAD
jgi:ATP-binding cassette subfamily B protein